MDSLMDAIIMLEQSKKETENSIRAKMSPAKFWALLPKNNDIFILQKPDFMWDIDVTLHRYYPRPTPMHKHDFYELVYVYKGSCINYLPSETLHMKAGDILLMNPNVYHSPFIDSPDNYVINILIQRHAFRRIIQALHSSDRLFLHFGMNHIYNLREFNDYLYFPYNINYPVYGIILSLTRELLKKEIMYQDAVFSSLAVLFVTLTRIYRNNTENVIVTGKDTLISNMLGYIEGHIQDVSLQHLTEKFHYSAGYLSNLIHEYTGKTFSEIVRNLRLNTAKNYLENEDFSIQQISDLCGFHDVSYFSRVFKQQYGCSPSSYSKKAKDTDKS